MKIPGRLVDIAAKGLGPINHLLQLIDIQTTVGGKDLVGQGYSAGLRSASNQGAEIAKGPVELAANNQYTDHQRTDQGQDCRQERRFGQQPAAQAHPTDQHQGIRQHHTEHTQGKRQKACKKTGP